MANFLSILALVAIANAIAIPLVVFALQKSGLVRGVEWDWSFDILIEQAIASEPFIFPPRLRFLTAAGVILMLLAIVAIWPLALFLGPSGSLAGSSAFLIGSVLLFWAAVEGHTWFKNKWLESRYRASNVE